MNEVKLYKGDCLQVMQELINKGVKADMILTDPPYGTIKGAALDAWDVNKTKWDEIIDTSNMFKCCSKILRENGMLLLFSQEPYTSKLRTSYQCNFSFCYPMIWEKNHFANALISKKAPVSYFEDISVFLKKHDDDLIHPLRAYSSMILKEINLSKKKIDEKLGHQKAQHFFRHDTSQFNIPTQETYNEIIEVFKIDKLDFFIEYKELVHIDSVSRSRCCKIFNLLGSKTKSNILKYSKEYSRLHPTQKPVALLEDLIKTYTNEGDTVLDFTMGSGSTGVACVNMGRKFIGIELDDKYFEIAEGRIKEAINNKQSTLF